MIKSFGRHVAMINVGCSPSSLFSVGWCPREEVYVKPYFDAVSALVHIELVIRALLKGI